MKTPASLRLAIPGGGGSAGDRGSVLLAVGAWALFCGVPGWTLLAAWLGDPNYSHGLLGPVVAGVLVWRARAELIAAGEGHRWGGVFPLVAGCGLVVLGHWYQVGLQPGSLGYVFLEGAGLLLATGGLLWMLAGGPRARLLAERLGFLVFTIPWPESLLQPLAQFLQRAVAVSASVLLRGLGVEVFREGNLLHFPSTVLHVAGACSGIRSLMAFFAVAAACAAFLRLRAGQTLGLLLLAPLVAVAGNLLRVLATSFLVLHGGGFWLSAGPHDLMGLAVVLLGGGVLFRAAQSLGGSMAPLPPERGAVPGARKEFRMWPAAVVAAGMLAFTAGVLCLTSRHYQGLARTESPVPVSRRTLAEFPRRIGDYQCTGEFQMSRREYDILRPSEQVLRTYENPAGSLIQLTLLYWGPRRAHPGPGAVQQFPHTPYSCLAYEGWTRLEDYDDAETHEWLPDRVISSGRFRKDAQERLVLFWNTNDEEDPRLFSPRHLGERFRLLVRSWSEIPEAIVPPTYSVKIELDPAGNFSAAKLAGLEFARAVALQLPEFGMGRPGGLSFVPPPEYAKSLCKGDS